VSQSAVGSKALRWHRVAGDPSSAAAALAFGSVVIMGLVDGGYYPSTWRWAGVALAAVAGMQLLLRRAERPSLLGMLSAGALTVLGAWMLLSSLWGIAGTEAPREAERCSLYVAVVCALLAVVRHETTRALLTGLLAGVTALAIFALGDHALLDPPLDPYQGSLLKEPVGYANALGLLMAIGVVLALGLLGDVSERALRCALLGSAGACGLALGLTSSRGAYLALIAGLVVLATCHVRSRIVLAGIALVAAIFAALVVSRASLGDRPSYWGVAVADAADHALLGSGAGSFDDVWLERRPIPAYVRDAHSLYLETAAELGVVGLALLLTALGAPLVAAASVGDRRLVATAAAGYVVFLVHVGLDWDWEMPVTVLAGLPCGAALLANARVLRDP
jgi:O-antigen ligase